MLSGREEESFGFNFKHSNQCIEILLRRSAKAEICLQHQKAEKGQEAARRFEPGRGFKDFIFDYQHQAQTNSDAFVFCWIKSWEVVKLRVEDIDVKRKLIRIRGGKGRKDRLHDTF